MPRINNLNNLVATQLTAPGRTDVKLKPQTSGAIVLEAIVTVASIDTSVSLNWDFSNVADFSVIEAVSPTTTITANGTYVLTCSVTNNTFAALNFAAEAGGTAATVDVTYNLYQ